MTSRAAELILNSVLECVLILAAKSGFPNKRPASRNEYIPKLNHPNPMRSDIKPIWAVVFVFLLEMSNIVNNMPMIQNSNAVASVRMYNEVARNGRDWRIPRTRITSRHIHGGSCRDCFNFCWVTRCLVVSGLWESMES